MLDPEKRQNISVKHFFRDNLQPKMSFEERILTLPETSAAIQTLMDEMCWPGDVFSKGQEISKGNFGVQKAYKIYLRNSALASKKRLN